MVGRCVGWRDGDLVCVAARYSGTRVWRRSERIETVAARATQPSASRIAAARPALADRGRRCGRKEYTGESAESASSMAAAGEVVNSSSGIVSVVYL
jgi:hypothetical protein